MNELCTSLEQSKKLTEFLPIGSADMCYVRATFDRPKSESWFVQLGKPIKSRDVIPCWSLTALLSYLNQDWYVNLSHDGICWQCIIDHHDRKERRCSSVLTDEPVDCCVELIVKLKEENLI